MSSVAGREDQVTFTPHLLFPPSERVCVADLQGLLIVPVAVGSALAALVFVLLIAYLVSRFVAHRRKKLYNKVS